VGEELGGGFGALLSLACDEFDVRDDRSAQLILVNHEQYGVVAAL